MKIDQPEQRSKMFYENQIQFRTEKYNTWNLNSLNWMEAKRGESLNIIKLEKSTDYCSPYPIFLFFR